MTLEEFLEKYNVTMNEYEINDITDSRIQYTKRKYRDLRRKVYEDEHGIPDQELWNEVKKINELEKKELEECYKEIYKD